MSKPKTLSTPLLDRAGLPDQLKQLDVGDLPMLAAEVREVIQDTVQYTGGHLGSGMGVVELTIALHYVFDFSNDRLVFDVGHQAYPHKILTGRRDQFHTLRQKDGISGFTNRFESIYDVYTMGHAGTATSAALGIALGDQLADKQRHVVSVVGDASMGAGIAFEALNHAGSLENTRMLVILNDNRWSIAQTIGALSKYLDRVRTGTTYNKAKENLHTLLKAIPVVGKDLDEKFDHAIDHVRKFVVPGDVFEELGLNYFGPIDGHDTNELVGYLNRVKDLDGVTLLHVRTNKGNGVPGSEERYDRAHAAKPNPRPKPELVKTEPQCVMPAKAPKSANKAWTSWFSDGIEELAERDEKVVALTAAMPDGTGLMKFGEKFPDRFFDVGIAEQHCVGLASGLATAGLKPVAAIYSTFLQRAYDILFQEVVVQDLPVTFAIDRAGFVGEDGISHHGLFDIAYLRTFPRMVLMAPKDGPELKKMLEFAVNLDCPNAIRFARGGAPADLPGVDGGTESAPIELGKMEVIRSGSDGAILAYGHMVKNALDAADLLAERGLSVEVVNARFVKPLDAEGILALLNRHDRVMTLEDHAVAGGFGSAVLELVASQEQPVRASIDVAGVVDQFYEHATRAELVKEAGLDAETLANRFLSKRPATVPQH